MIYHDGTNRWIDEDWPTDRYPRAAGNHAAEANARRFAGIGGIAVVLRFGIYGHGAAHSEQIMAMARRHIGFQAGRPHSYASSIHLADAADAVVASVKRHGGTYNIVDDEPITTRDNASVLADAVGAQPWLCGPGRLALLLGDRTTSNDPVTADQQHSVPLSHHLEASVPQRAGGLPGDGQRKGLNCYLWLPEGSFLLFGADFQRRLEKYMFNPAVTLALRLAVTPKAFALLETTGRRSVRRRLTPVGNGLDGDVFWLVSEHGTGCDYVKTSSPSRIRV